MPSHENARDFHASDQAASNTDNADPEFSAYAANAFGGPVLDLSYGGDFPEGQAEFSGIRSATRIHYEESTDELGQTYIIRTDLETGQRERFILPPPTARG